MKNVFELLLAWLLGTVVPVLLYFQIIFWITLMDCMTGVMLARRKKEFNWQKFFETFFKGAAFMVLLVIFKELEKAFQIPAIDIGAFHFDIVMFVGGLIFVNELESIEQKTIELWGFGFFQPIKEKFKIFQNFNKTPSNDKPE